VAPQVTVIGLGPAGADLILPAARTAFVAATARYVRTARHPAVADLAADGIAFESFDALYDTAPDFDTVYATIAESLVESAQRGDSVAYAVPGSPTVAERSVGLLRVAAVAAGVDVRILPGLSFADLAWARLGVDALGGVRVLDARTLVLDDLDAPGGVLFAQCDTPLVLSDLKLTLLERLAPDAPATVLHHLGAPDERVERMALADLDRFVPDHLTAVYVEVVEGGAGAEFAALVALARRLRGPGGCPWDAEQTHHSLTRYLLEESYEVVEVLEGLPADAPDGTGPDEPAYPALADELGDLLFQVVIHAVLADEAGAFGPADVARGIVTKLVRRHPHVFGEAEAETADAVVTRWEQIKQAERGSTSLLGEVPAGLPALLSTHKLFRKAATVGLSPGRVAGAATADEAPAVAAVDAALRRLRADPRDGDALGDLLAAAVAVARDQGVDAESTLRRWTADFRARFVRMERLAAERGLSMSGLDPSDAAALWDDAQDQGERGR
jgi:tetrapyrrole methylase family protein/MazG family protein